MTRAQPKNIAYDILQRTQRAFCLSLNQSKFELYRPRNKLMSAYGVPCCRRNRLGRIWKEKKWT